MQNRNVGQGYSSVAEITQQLNIQQLWVQGRAIYPLKVYFA